MNEACTYGEERLVGLLYDDADAAEAGELRAHVAQCAGCRIELKRMTEMKQMLSAWPNAVNAPRMVYVNERAGMLTRLRRWASQIGSPDLPSLLKPAVAAAMVVLVVAAWALLEVRVTPDGRVQLGLAGTSAGQGSTNDGASAADAPLDAADVAPTTQDPSLDPSTGANLTSVTQDELDESLAQAVADLEELWQARSAEQQQLLLAAIDERMQEQGLAMSQQLAGAVDGAFAAMEQQHENDLGLVFSAIDELGVVAGVELQRMNTILASLMQRTPNEEE